MRYRVSEESSYFVHQLKKQGNDKEILNLWETMDDLSADIVFVRPENV